jgi:hypothetical protein
LDYDAFSYGLSFTGNNRLLASQTITLPIAINSDSAFLILSSTMVVTSVDNLTFLASWPILVQLNEGGGSRNLFNTPQHAMNVFGTAQRPYYWQVPKLLMPNSTFNVTLQNLEATDRHVHVTFSGFKIFGWSR